MATLISTGEIRCVGSTESAEMKTEKGLPVDMRLEAAHCLVIYDTTLVETCITWNPFVYGK